MRRNTTARTHTFGALLAVGFLARSAPTAAQDVPGDERITPANAARIEPVARVGRTLHGVHFAGPYGLWLHASDGLFHQTSQGAMRRVVGDPDLLYADRDPPDGSLTLVAPVDGGRELRRLEPGGASATTAFALDAGTDRLRVSRNGSVAVAFVTAVATVLELNPAAHAWRRRARFRALGSMQNAALSPDGTRLAVSSGRQLAVYDTARGTAVARAPEPRSWCNWQQTTCPDRSAPVDTRWLDVCVAADGRVLAAGGTRVAGVPGVHRVDLFTVGRGARPLVELAGTLERVQFSPDCARVALQVLDASGRMTLEVADTRSGDVLGQLALPPTDLKLAWSSDGARLAVTTDRLARVWSLDGSGDAIVVTSESLGALFAPSGEPLNLTDLPAAVRAWFQASVLGEARFNAILPPSSDLRVNRLSADGRTAVFTRGASVVVTDLTGASPDRAFTLNGPAAYLALHPQGSVLALTNAAGDIELRALPGGGVRRTIHPPEVVTRLAWSGDGTHLAANSRDGALYVWRGGDGGAVPLPASEARFTFAPWGATGMFALRGEGASYLWTPGAARMIPLPTNVWETFASSDDRSVLCGVARGSDAGVSSVALRASDGGTLREVTGTRRCALSPDGAYALWESDAAPPNDAVTVMSLRDGVERPVPGLPSFRVAFAVSPDGSIVAVRGMGVVTLHEVGTGRELIRMRVSQDARVLRFSPDGTLLVLATTHPQTQTTQTAEVWAVPTERSGGGASPWVPRVHAK